MQLRDVLFHIRIVWSSEHESYGRKYEVRYDGEGQEHVQSRAFHGGSRRYARNLNDHAEYTDNVCFEAADLSCIR